MAANALAHDLADALIHAKQHDRAIAMARNARWCGWTFRSGGARWHMHTRRRRQWVAQPRPSAPASAVANGVDLSPATGAALGDVAGQQLVGDWLALRRPYVDNRGEVEFPFHTRERVTSPGPS